MLHTLSRAVPYASSAVPVTLLMAALSACSSPVTGAEKRLATAFTLSTILENMFSPPCDSARSLQLLEHTIPSFEILVTMKFW